MRKEHASYKKHNILEVRQKLEEMNLTDSRSVIEIYVWMPNET